MPSTTNTNIEAVWGWGYTDSNGTAKTFRSIQRYTFGNTSLTPAPNAFFTAWLAAYGTTLVAQLSANVIINSFTLRIMDDSTLLPVAATNVGTTYVGGISGDSLPIDKCITFQLKTGKRGRNYRGSKHYPGVPEASTLKDELTTTATTALAALKAGHTVTINDGVAAWQPVIVNGSLSQLVNPTTIVATSITSAVLNKTIGVIKRRKEKGVYA